MGICSPCGCPLFSHGNDDGYTTIGDYGWYSANSDGKSHPVGLKLPNPWGLHDIHGNVREYTYNLEGNYSSGAQVDPTGPTTATAGVGSQRNHRGGSWRFGADNLRSASRRNNNYGPKSWTGFRIVREPDGE